MCANGWYNYFFYKNNNRFGLGLVAELSVGVGLIPIYKNQSIPVFKNIGINIVVQGNGKEIFGLTKAGEIVFF